MFSVIASPLTDALKGDKRKGKIEWTDTCHVAFQKLKELLCTKPILHAPNFNRQFIVQTDASDFGMGIVLSQVDDKQNEHPILYLSKKFSNSERKYCTTERECAAIIYAIKKLHFYLDGHQEFLIQTDHNPLTWLKSNSNSNSRLMRWALALQPYNFKIVHRKGTLHKNVDVLSRIK